MGALAYPTTNAVKNLDTITIFIFIYLLMLVFCLALVIYMIRKQRFREIEKMNGRQWIHWERDWRRWGVLVKIRKFLTKVLFWRVILGLLIEAFLIFAIAGLMQI